MNIIKKLPEVFGILAGCCVCFAVGVFCLFIGASFLVATSEMIRVAIEAWSL